MPQPSALSSDWLPQDSSNCELVNSGEKHKNLLKCCLLNAHSICNKLPELHNLLYRNNYDIVCITESWLHANTPNSLFDPQCKFNIVRTDREGLVGGGVCMFISSSLSFIEITTHSVAGEFELCCVDVINKTCSSLRIMNVYRASNHTHKSVESAHSLIEQLQTLSRARTHCILVGDLNCPHISWTNLTAPSDNIQDALLDFTVNNSLEQLVNIATRGDNILDLVLSSEPTSVAQIKVTCPFSSSDHCRVNFDNFVDSNNLPMYTNSTGLM